MTTVHGKTPGASRTTWRQTVYCSIDVSKNLFCPCAETQFHHCPSEETLDNGIVTVRSRIEEAPVECTGDGGRKVEFADK